MGTKVKFAGVAGFLASLSVASIVPAFAGQVEFRGEAIITKIVTHANNSGIEDACDDAGWGVGGSAKVRFSPGSDAKLPNNDSNWHLNFFGTWGFTGISLMPSNFSNGLPSRTEIVVPTSQTDLIGRGSGPYSKPVAITVTKLVPSYASITPSTESIYFELSFVNFFNRADATNKAGAGSNGCDVTMRGSATLQP